MLIGNKQQPLLFLSGFLIEKTLHIHFNFQSLFEQIGVPFQVVKMAASASFDNDDLVEADTGMGDDPVSKTRQTVSDCTCLLSIICKIHLD